MCPKTLVDQCKNSGDLLCLGYKVFINMTYIGRNKVTDFSVKSCLFSNSRCLNETLKWKLAEGEMKGDLQTSLLCIACTCPCTLVYIAEEFYTHSRDLPLLSIWRYIYWIWD